MWAVANVAGLDSGMLDGCVVETVASVEFGRGPKQQVVCKRGREGAVACS